MQNESYHFRRGFREQKPTGPQRPLTRDVHNSMEAGTESRDEISKPRRQISQASNFRRDVCPPPELAKATNPEQGHPVNRAKKKPARMIPPRARARTSAA